jgi:hypothetical protein
MGPRSLSNPQAYSRMTIRLHGLVLPADAEAKAA